MVVAYGFSIEALVYCLFGCMLAGIALTDLETYTVPNGFILATLLIWLAGSLFLSVDAGSLAAWLYTLTGSSLLATLGDGLIGALVVSLVLLLLALICDRILGRPSLGGGDIKLVFACGLYLGLLGNVLNLIVACVIGIVFGAVTSRRRCDNEDPAAFPFAPSIALAAWLCLLFGPQLIAAYATLL
jgi:leader peptidase (prepilin peptidase) / N-methyltransferase